jgi:hypothetical protein
MSVSAEQKLKIHINGIINAFHRSPYLNRLIHSMIEYGDEKARKRVGEIYVEPMLAAYDAIIAQGVREGAFRSIDSQFLYYSLVGACEKIFNAKTDVTSNLPGPERIGDKTKDEYVAYVTRLFLHGLLSTSASR